MNSLVKAISLSASLLLAHAAQSAYLFINDLGPGEGGFTSSTLDFFGEPPGYAAADRFSLNESALVSSVYWWGHLKTGTTDFRIDFYQDQNGAPGSLLSSSGGTLLVTDLPENPYSPLALGDFARYALQLDHRFEAAADTGYWISIFNQAENASWTWQFSQWATPDSAVSRKEGDAVWFNPIESHGFSGHLAFALSAEDLVVPLPPALALFISPLVALFGVRLFGKRRQLGLTA